MTQPKCEIDDNHNGAIRSAWRPFIEMCRRLVGDPVLIPEGKTSITRDDLVKISHWSDITEADIPRLAILTDSFARFIGEGEDASVLTIWRQGTPDVMLIEGDSEAALDLVTDVIIGNAEELTESAIDYTNPDPMQEKLAELADRFERGLEERHAANDNHPQLLRARRQYGGRIEGGTLNGAVINRAIYSIRVIDGDLWLLTPAGLPFQRLPALTPPIHATPFSLRNPATLPERDWMFGRHYIRRYLTSTVGAGGGGKSAHAVSESLAMVTGRPLLDPDGPLTAPLRVWYINAEDPQDEIDRRFHAAAKHFSVTAEHIGGRLYTDSGRDQEFVVMKQDGRNFKVCQPVVDELVTEIRLRQIDVVIVDPFVSTHEVPENDNSSMQRVAKAWTEVADRANCCVEVIHHVVKNGGEVTADSARGGGALKDKTRSMRVLNAMTDAEATKVGLDNPDGYFRIDLGKFNMTAKGHSAWRRFVSVPLGNGKGLLGKGDEIGVVESWLWPSQEVVRHRAAEARRAVVVDVPEDMLAGLKVRLDSGSYKADPKGKPWAGDVLVETGIAADRDKAKAMLSAWVEVGELRIAEEIDPVTRHLRKFVKSAATT